MPKPASIQTSPNRLVQARMLAASNRYEESLALYTDVFSHDPANNTLFMELLRVKAILAGLRSAMQLLQVQRDIGIIQARQAIDGLLADPRYEAPLRLERFGHKIYSQNDEDGIIAEIFRRIGVTNRVFFEFGVEDGLESNTHLLLHQGWTGAWAEANENHTLSIRDNFKVAIAGGHLRVSETRITRENINDLVRGLNLPEEIDLISIDIDSNDYWVFKELSATHPRVAVIEYNAKFLPPMKRVIPYQQDRTWNGSDYHGCSLQSLTDLAEARGYSLVACNITGVNAFFVRTDLCRDQFPTPATAEFLYQPPRFELGRAGGFERGHAAQFGLWLNNCLVRRICGRRQAPVVCQVRDTARFP